MALAGAGFCSAGFAVAGVAGAVICVGAAAGGGAVFSGFFGGTRSDRRGSGVFCTTGALTRDVGLIRACLMLSVTRETGGGARLRGALGQQQMGNPEMAEINRDIGRGHAFGVLHAKVGTGGDGGFEGIHVIHFNSVEQSLVRALRGQRQGDENSETNAQQKNVQNRRNAGHAFR